MIQFWRNTVKANISRNSCYLRNGLYRLKILKMMHSLTSQNYNKRKLRAFLKGKGSQPRKHRNKIKRHVITGTNCKYTE